MEEVRSDTMKEQVVVTVVDTIKETTTITLVLRQAKEPSEPDDTVRMTTVTDRTRSRDCSQLRVKSEKLKVETDTVYVEKDSLRFTVYGLQNPDKPPVSGKLSAVSKILKWIFWILLILTVLIIVVRISIFKR